MGLHDLAALLRAVDRNLAPPLFSGAARERLRRLAFGFPALLGWGIFECRLSDADRVDFFIAPSTQTGGQAAVREAIRAQSGLDRLGLMVPLLAAWTDPESVLHRSVPVIHLEYDLPSDANVERADPFAQCCLQRDFPTLAPVKQSLCDIDHLLRTIFSYVPGYRTRDEVLATMGHCLNALPDGSSIVHAGVMPQRGREEIRTVFSVPLAKLHAWLNEVEWPGDFAALDRLLALISPYWSHIALQCDVGERFGPVLAIDYDEPSLPGTAPLLTEFMQRLVRARVASADKAMAALGWIGTTTHRFADLTLPLCVVRELDVKLVLQADGDLEAKAYLGAYLGYTPYF
jgi:hypothetical protein